jgi:nitrous oxidase accessory protein NosD
METLLATAYTGADVGVVSPVVIIRGLVHRRGGDDNLELGGGESGDAAC